jgi:hypothetical protein
MTRVVAKFESRGSPSQRAEGSDNARLSNAGSAGDRYPGSGTVASSAGAPLRLALEQGRLSPVQVLNPHSRSSIAAAEYSPPTRQGLHHRAEMLLGALRISLEPHHLDPVVPESSGTSTPTRVIVINRDQDPGRLDTPRSDHHVARAALTFALLLPREERGYLAHVPHVDTDRPEGWCHVMADRGVEGEPTWLGQTPRRLEPGRR